MGHSPYLHFETNNSGLGTTVLSFLVFKQRELSSLELQHGTAFWSSDLPMFSSWYQGISMPSLVEIVLSLLVL